MNRFTTVACVACMLPALVQPPATTYGGELRVATPDEFEHAIKMVKAGDVIAIADGRYKDWRVTLSCGGEPEQPIVVRPATEGGVTFTGIASAGEKGPAGQVLFFEDFSQGMENWWVEGGHQVLVKDGRLYVNADPPKGVTGGGVCTVWCKKQFPADVRVEFDAHVVESSPNVNNINFLLCYSDPTGKPLYETRDSRKTAKYSLYHKLNGHIFTYLCDSDLSNGANPDGSAKARFRIRRNPGFNLLDEAFGYHCEKGKTYHVVLSKVGGNLSIAVDGQVYCRAMDEQPLKGGLLGLRTYRTHLWWDNIRVVEAKR